MECTMGGLIPMVICALCSTAFHTDDFNPLSGLVVCFVQRIKCALNIINARLLLVMQKGSCYILY